MGYQAPLKEIALAIQTVGGFESADVAESANAIFEEAGKFASGVLEPINKIGDTNHPKLEDGRVKTSPGWVSAYKEFVAKGWNALPGSPDFGGSGLPALVGMPVTEIFNATNPSFALCPMLTQGAANLLTVGASDEQKALYLPKMIEGRWTGAMDLTEAQAGSDLSSVRTTATPQPNGTYRIKGTKIFITYGDHDLTENTIHLVLARLPDAPAGVKGISLFIVPKVLVNADGSLGERNDVICTKLEHKLGIHGSPTCELHFGENGGAVGYLVGAPNDGLRIMFLMMNEERLGMGLQGVGIASAAYQHALAYANDRVQGKPITSFPDVRRMLFTMKARTASARMICYAAARQLDLVHSAASETEREAAIALAALLTPVAKAYGTDVAVEVASLGMQVFGGMGYMEESGAPQFWRDARIGSIYEGTNGIQAIALAVRNVAKSKQFVAQEYTAFLQNMLAEVWQQKIDGFVQNDDLEDERNRAGNSVGRALQALEMATKQLVAKKSDDNAVLSAATPYLRLFAIATGGVYLAKAASDTKDPKDIALARYFAEHESVAASALLARVCNDSSVAGTDLL